MIGSGNGLVPKGNMPLPEPMLTQIHVAICHHKATMSLCVFISSVLPSSYLYKDSLYSERLSLHIYMKWLIQYKDASIENPIVQIRRFYNSFISTTGFPILVNEWLSLTAFLRQPTLVRWHLYVESGPRCIWAVLTLQPHAAGMLQCHSHEQQAASIQLQLGVQHIELRNNIHPCHTPTNRGPTVQRS